MLAAFLGGPTAAAAAAFDGSRPMLCAAMTVMECERSGECARRTVEDVDLPALLRIDVVAKLISAADGGARTADIRSAASIDGRLVLQGAQMGRGWTLVIVEESGRMSATVADATFSFTVFGACAVPGT
jgi:hypothetical protein